MPLQALLDPAPRLSGNKSEKKSYRRDYTRTPSRGSTQILRRSSLHSAAYRRATVLRPVAKSGEERRVWPHTSPDKAYRVCGLAASYAQNAGSISRATLAQSFCTSNRLSSVMTGANLVNGSRCTIQIVRGNSKPEMRSVRRRDLSRLRAKTR